MTRSFMSYPAAPSWMDLEYYQDLGRFLDYKMRSGVSYTHFAETGPCYKFIWGDSFFLDRGFVLFPIDSQADLVLFVRGDPRSPTAPAQKFQDPSWYGRMIPSYAEILELLGPDVRVGPRVATSEESRERNRCGGGLIF